MLQRYLPHLRAFHFLLDISVTLLALVASAETYRVLNHQTLLTPAQLSAQYQQALGIVLLWTALLQIRHEHYAYRLKTTKHLIKDTAQLVGYGSALLLVGSYLLHLEALPRLQLAVFIGMDFAALLTMRTLFLRLLHYYRSRGRNMQRLLIVGTRERVKKAIDLVTEQRQWGYRPVGLVHLDPINTHYRYRDVPLIGLLGDFSELIKSRAFDRIIFTVPSRCLDEVRPALQVCDTAGIPVCLQLDILNLTSGRYRSGELEGTPALFYSREPELEATLIAKSLVDRLAALAGLLLAAPLLAVIAAAIRLTSRGPAVFSQIRCGIRGREFKLYKFRTMIANADELKESLRDQNEMTGPVFKIKDDPRVTGVGKVLRRLSLDELPQLFNVLKGDMSLVGPRPPLPAEVNAYDLWQRRKLSMKPGLTCLWQVGRRNAATFDEWMKQDLEYIDNWSLWLDAKVIARTIPAVLRATGQ